MAYTTINKSTEHFNTKLYTGNGSTQTISGIGHQPDWLWIKCRSNANGSVLFDALRTTYSISSSDSSAEANRASDGFTSLDSDGFTMNGSGNGGNLNVNSRTYAAWNWKANGAGSSNTAGTINSTVSVNTTAGFSIVKWTGNGVAGASIGHGLGVVPKTIMVKRLNDTANWTVYHHKLGNTHRLELNTTTASTSDGGAWNNTSPTSTLFYTGNNLTEGNNGSNYIAYCFAEKQGYSKFGSYTATGSADGNFIYTGFAPKFIIMKRTDTSGYNWVMYDDKRNTYNPWTNLLLPNLNNAEITSGGAIDFLSNGFKLRSSSGANPTTNQGTIVYMAFGQSLVGSNNVPATAR